MEKKVTKKSGYKEPFIKEKIVTSAVKSGSPVDIARIIADEVEEQPDTDLKTKWLRQYVINKLIYHNKTWHENWVNYDKRMKRFYEYDY
ncbi:MAG TPA: ATP cone domain-containing protein [Candidatus Thermoplasmatota archaeon]|nr:ATP cone domain-containing protein [Candidatus Thermoplasmatota archaeon]